MDMDDISIAEKYKQQYAHFGRLNEILYRLTVLFSTDHLVRVVHLNSKKM